MFSGEIDVGVPIIIPSGSPDGSYTVRVVGCDAAGNWQPVELATEPPEWTVYTKFNMTMATPLGVGTASPATAQSGPGEAVAISALAGSGYIFSRWVATGPATFEDYESAVTTVTLAGDASVRAVFGTLVVSYTLNYSAQAHGAVTGEAVQVVVRGAGGSSVTAVAEAGYHFSGWSDGVMSATRVDSNVMASIAVSAHFALDAALYTVIFAAGAHGSLSGDLTQSVAYGDSCTRVFALSATGYRFSRWSDGSTYSYLTLTGVTCDMTLTAFFEIETGYRYLKYQASTGGSIAGNADQSIPTDSTGSQVTAVALAGYHFKIWSDGSARATRTDTAGYDKTFTAYFEVNFFTVAYAATDGGSVTGTLIQKINAGSFGSEVVATPDEGHHFTYWSDGLATAARTEYDVTYNMTLTANFLPDASNVTLAYSAGLHGAIEGVATQSVPVGGSGSQVTAVPDAGYRFAYWDDGVGTAARTDSNVMFGKAPTAYFERLKYTLEYTAEYGGEIQGTTLQTVSPGGDGTYVAAGAHTGYRFIKWSDGLATAGRVDWNVTCSLSVSAFFDIIKSAYVLTYTAGMGGSISGSKTQLVASGGTGSSVTAMPAAGHHFVMWSDGLATAARTDSLVYCDKALTAYFAADSAAYLLAYATDGNGTLAGAAVQSVASGGSGTEVVAVANTGYHFSGWSDGYARGARTDLNVKMDITATAMFALGGQNCVVTYSAGPCGSVTGILTQSVAQGGACTAVTAVPDSGYHFVTWSDGSTSATRTDLGVACDRTYMAVFDPSVYTADYRAGPNGSISGSAHQLISHGHNASSVTGVPSGYYRKSHWSDGYPLTANMGVRVDQAVDHNIDAAIYFYLPTYSVSVSAGAGGTATPDTVGGAIAMAGETVVALRAEPAVGYVFSKWTVLRGSAPAAPTAADTTVTVGADTSIRADFAVLVPSAAFVSGVPTGTTNVQGGTVVVGGSNVVSYKYEIVKVS